METKIVIAGSDAHKYDKSDWDIAVIPVYLNAQDLPHTVTIEQVEAMIKYACFAWSLRYVGHTLHYKGLYHSVHKPGAVVVTYTTGDVIYNRYGQRTAGLCMYHYRDWNGKKWVMDSCEVYIDKAARPVADDFALALMMHEFGHVCGIAGHIDEPGHVMSTGRHRNYILTLRDCQALDNWNPYPVALNRDFSLSCPSVDMPDGHHKWVDLPYTGNHFIHSWEIGRETVWEKQIACNNVTFGDLVEHQGQMCQRLHMADVQGLDLKVWADLVIAPNGRVILRHAE
ncbi:hypothetical protein [Pseudohongiella sp. O18]|uniref:hypothetical protein n=1 Tax=Pseudohongiella sp. O18 TaxID=2904248 RepID=UPI001F37835C|nr:hypothetical protein [Pseudohongiella sp. O18]